MFINSDSDYEGLLHAVGGLLLVLRKPRLTCVQRYLAHGRQRFASTVVVICGVSVDFVTRLQHIVGQFSLPLLLLLLLLRLLIGGARLPNMLPLNGGLR